MEIIQEVKEILESRYLAEGGHIEVTYDSGVLLVEGTIPIRQYVAMIRDLSATSDKSRLKIERIGCSETVLPPGQARLEKTSYRNPYSRFTIHMSYNT